MQLDIFTFTMDLFWHSRGNDALEDQGITGPVVPSREQRRRGTSLPEERGDVGGALSVYNSFIGEICEFQVMLAVSQWQGILG